MAHFIKLDRYDRTRVLGKPWAMVTVELVARKRLQVQADSLGTLVVPGADADMSRVSHLIRRLGDKIDGISTTMDSHQTIGIERPRWWIRVSDGAEVAPFTCLGIHSDGKRIVKLNLTASGPQQTEEEYTTRIPHMLHIGDEIAWGSVPDGALVREVGGPHNDDYTLKLDGRGWLAFAQMAGVWRAVKSMGTPWDEIADHSPTVIVVALDLTAEVEASYLEQRAGIFEIWAKLESHSLPQRVVYEHETIVLPDALYADVAASSAATPPSWRSARRSPSTPPTATSSRSPARGPPSTSTAPAPSSPASPPTPPPDPRRPP